MTLARLWTRKRVLDQEVYCRMNRRHAITALLVGLTLLLVPVAFAAKGGNASAGSNGATITFDQATVVVGQQYHVNGSGFSPNTWVTVGAHFSDTTWWNSQVTDGQGSFSLVFTATSSGQVYHEAKEQGNNARLRLMATATLSVSPAP
jgi:hypothetical protein